MEHIAVAKRQRSDIVACFKTSGGARSPHSIILLNAIDAKVMNAKVVTRSTAKSSGRLE